MFGRHIQNTVLSKDFARISIYNIYLIFSIFLSLCAHKTTANVLLFTDMIYGVLTCSLLTNIVKLTAARNK